MLLSRQVPASAHFSKELQQFLYGREYPLEEIPFPEHVIRNHAKAGWVTLRNGIDRSDDGFFSSITGRKKWTCRRCGNTDSTAFASCSCGRCGRECIYCRHCLNMGIIRSCTKLAMWSGPAPDHAVPQITQTERLCTWAGKLSPEQANAAAKLDTALSAGESFLIWAVTGSGKTELLFPAIEHALLRGDIVVLATPRTDVVRELYPRMKAAFPKVPISALYGGSRERLPAAPLVIATTHQLVRFHCYFDRVFIDEVDAFPFHFDPMLAYAVGKAARQGAPVAYLSATPPANLKNDFQSGKLCGVKIARRYHGYPLPVPQYRWAGDWLQSVRKGVLPHAFLEWIREKNAAARPLFCFVPSVALSRNVTELLQKEGFASVAGVHAQDPDRHEKVSSFREGKIHILVTTTILERGVTIPGAEAAVFGADDPVFDERALVQISGRVGRSADCPDGDILFFHNGKTLEMVRARHHIEKMNKEGGF